ncbi:MAG: hypothetical protein GXP04_08375, partial [Alphaproteobacteria bacterium]|nr:hypothetical protein [Alphaproteobacteria bacterium]
HETAAQLTRLFRWGETRDRWAAQLPDERSYRQFGLKKGGVRLRIDLDGEMETLLRAFDHPASLYAELDIPLADRKLTPAPSMGDALIAMLWTAARVHDALSFSTENFASSRLIYRQSKRGRVCNLPIIGPLKTRLPAMRLRAQAQRNRDDINDLIISETDGLSYARNSAKTGVPHHSLFNERWRAYRALAGEIAPSLIGEGVDPLGEPCKAFNAQDCRDTAVSRLAMATESIIEIAAWHGSDPEEIARLAKHYLAIRPEHADRAGEKLTKMCAEMGIAV